MWSHHMVPALWHWLAVTIQALINQQGHNCCESVCKTERGLRATLGKKNDQREQESRIGPLWSTGRAMHLGDRRLKNKKAVKYERAARPPLRHLNNGDNYPRCTDAPALEISLWYQLKFSVISAVSLRCTAWVLAFLRPERFTQQAQLNCSMFS